ncbi:PREDICTED: trypsin alpha-like [Ceratosolen solmsi marchali]|uniref:Trypsin alpha-like n=1 Tax=Ceratosolen solmsi marchali TaxID=326594 RepID=A0AAJ7DVY1_9HYME|nr:PREDICTED: trypsin alpha-like [Ceratosolen solmsi marchali]
MQRELLIFLLQAIIFYNHHGFAISKALIGSNIRAAYDNEFPSVVCIVRNEVSPERYAEYLTCTGTLISRQHVITAAHCMDVFSQSVSLVVYGSVDVRHGRRLPVAWWISYMQWSTSIGLDIPPSAYIYSDISVIKLTSEVDRRINPSNLSPMAQNRLMGHTFVMAGCGEANHGMFPTNIERAEVTSISNRECEQRATEIQGWFVAISDSNFCSVADPFVLTSPGDSGGPLLHRNFIVAVNIGPYPDLHSNYHARQANYHVGIDHYRHYISVMLQE